MAEAKGVLVLGELAGRELASVSLELLAAGRKIADDLGEELAIALLGASVESASQQAISYGADRVFAVTHPLLEQYQVDLYLSALESLCREASPNILLMARSEAGRELAPAWLFAWAWAWPRIAWRCRWTPRPGACWPTAQCTAAMLWPWLAATSHPRLQL